MSLFLSGSGAPNNALGADSDMYLDTTNERLYGPKTGGMWAGFITLGATVSVVGNKSTTQRITLRTDTSANFTNENPVLAGAEPGFEIDTGLLKIGTGMLPWQQLPYLSTGSGGSSYVLYVDGGYVADN